MWDNIIMVSAGLFVVALLVIGAFFGDKKQRGANLVDKVPAAIAFKPHRCRFVIHTLRGNTKVYRCICGAYYGRSWLANGEWKHLPGRYL